MSSLANDSSSEARTLAKKHSPRWKPKRQGEGLKERSRMTEKIVLPPQPGEPSDVERIKTDSNYLRGTLERTMNDPLSSGIPEDDNRLMKFHGSYLQDDRDLRNERQRQKLEPAYQFMVRVRTPGGAATPAHG